ncbi:hypothetical protein TYRP_000869 [Tyrophagus putrescentiae]|nr:hypothetical protein TYRP_000869 [Tyrophagus putrescentiae]
MFRLVLSPQKLADRSLLSALRQCSTNIPKNFVSFTATSNTSRIMDTSNAQTGREIDLLELKDTRFRLPGNVGIFVNNTWLKKLEKMNQEQQQQQQQQTQQHPQQPQPLKSTALTNEELLKNLNEDKPMPNTDMFLADDRAILQCDAFECPILLVKDFQELFPSNTANLINGLTVLTITHKSQNDMAAWSSEVIAERDELMEKFLFTADRMCSYLKSQGFWADFIDPASGRAYHGEYTPSTFFETDERYRKFGFEIEDLGCCKVISHSKWGTKAFVGALFTNAPVDHASVQALCIYMDD